MLTSIILEYIGRSRLLIINAFQLVSSYISINNWIFHSPSCSSSSLFFVCDSSISILMSKSLSVFTGRKEEETWFATRRSFNYKTICTGRRREKGMSLFVYVICILNAILTLLTPVLMNFSGIVVSKLQMSLPVRPATKAEQMRECLRSLKQNHKVNNSKLLYQ